jgi:hypothetical protein
MAPTTLPIDARCTGSRMSADGNRTRIPAVFRVDIIDRAGR